MNQLKALGLAAIAATALLAILGSGTASATQLCRSASTPCPSGDTYGSGTLVSGSLTAATEAVLTTNIDTVKCASSAVQMTTTSAGGTGVGLTASLTGLTFTSCKDSFGTSCTVKSVNLPYTSQFFNGGASAELQITSASGAGASVVCGSLINCTFTTKDTVLAVEGAATPPTVTATKASLNRSGGICPSTSTWTAKYNLTAPTPMMVI